MKKIFLVVIALLLTVGMLPGCKKNPESPIVVGKNAERMIEDAKKGETDSKDEPDSIVKSLAEQYGIPEEYQFEKSSGAKLLVKADAKVIVPDTDKMPIINVKSTVFSQETVDKYWAELIGDTQMWNDSEQPTKADIEKMIINYKQMLAESESDGDSESINALNEGISSLERMYQSAPVTEDPQIATSQLKEMLEWDPVSGQIDTRYTGFRASSAKNASERNIDGWADKFIRVHNPWTGEEGSIKSSIMPAQIYFDTPSVGNNYRGGELIGEDEVLSDEVRKLLTLTPKEAVTKVEEFLQKTGSPMVVDSIYLISDNINSDGTEKTPEHYAYELQCKRVAAGIPVGGQGGTMDSEATFNKPWDYERMSIRIDDDGVIDMVWDAPLLILDTEVEDSNLLPFSEVRDIFEKMIFITSEAGIPEGQRKEYHISTVRLELMRIIKQNTDLEGILVPVWNFYGSLAEFDESNNPRGKSRFLSDQRLLFSINAIDGSIIDTDRGY